MDARNEGNPMAKRTVSIYDIAKLAGVSTATVSNVLNEKGSYSQKTRDLVLRIAREQGYVANFAAKSLRESSTKTVALLTPDVSNDFFSTLVLKVEGLLRTAGYSSYICNTGNDSEREDEYVALVNAQGVETKCEIEFSDVQNVKARLASALPAGQYTLKVYTRSGFGGEFGVHVATRKVMVA